MTEPFTVQWVRCEHGRRLIDCAEPWHDSGVGPVIDVPRRLRWLQEEYAQPARDTNPARWPTTDPIAGEGWAGC